MTSPRIRAALLALTALVLPPAAARGATPRPLLAIAIDDKDGALKAPEGVACGEKGGVVVADTGNGRLLTYAYRDGRLSGGAPIKLAELTTPVRVQIGAHGDVLALDRRTRRIVRVGVDGKFAGAVGLHGASGSVAPWPIAFKLDAADRLLVLDAAGRRVLLASPEGKVERELPLPGAPAEFTDVAVDGAGRILAVDAVASRLWAAEKDAKAFKALGEGLKDRVSFPVYLAELRGRLLLVDQHGHGLVVVGSDGSFQGRELEMGWSEGKVYYPAQVCVSGEGVLFVADRNNNRVQVFSEAR